MTYVEGASLHQERGGVDGFARYAFNELVGFVAGWAMLLDYIILVARRRGPATNYLAAFWGAARARRRRRSRSRWIIAYVGLPTSAASGRALARARTAAGLVDLVLQIAIVASGWSLVLRLVRDRRPIDLGTSPEWGEVAVRARGSSTVAFTGLESASGLAGEVEVSAAGSSAWPATAPTSRSSPSTSGSRVVADRALPVSRRTTALAGSCIEAPVRRRRRGARRAWLIDVVTTSSPRSRSINADRRRPTRRCSGLARWRYSLATNRQIPAPSGGCIRRASRRTS